MKSLLIFTVVALLLVQQSYASCSDQQDQDQDDCEDERITDGYEVLLPSINLLLISLIFAFYSTNSFKINL
ncbi:hypothetical protein O3M35_007026 [Rhynocoris fuscipes]|uniref:Uncharacterized protein n=1 Tax=Rhynocoris fuscipes TaxID=488301 RepID=A0AAW1DN76_9HEMI